MSKLIKILLTVFGLFVFFGISAKLNPVNAQCVCANWEYHPYTCTVDEKDASGNVIGSTTGWCSYAICTDNNSYNGCTSPQCDPGTYPCNRASDGYCCPQNEPQPTTNPGCTSNCCSGCSCTNSCTGNPATCDQTAPTNLSTTRLSSTSVLLQWTPGNPGGSNPYQALYVSTNPDPQTGCAGTSGGTSVCPVKQDSSTTAMASTQSSYTVNNLSANTVYYWTVMNIQDANCASYSTSSSPYVSSCSVTPSSVTINHGSTQLITSSLTSGTGITQVTFTSNDTSKVTVSPGSDASYSYQTTATGVAPTSSAVTITENVYVTGGTIGCTNNITVNVLAASPWWQVKDADVASTGTLNSAVPTGDYFSLAGAGGYPGIPSYIVSTSLDNLNVSQLGWLVQSDNPTARQYDYSFFNNQVPADAVITTLSSNVLDQATINANVTPSYGYYWYRYDGSTSGLDLTINSDLVLGTRKVVVLAESSSVNISALVNFTKGSGFFLIVAGKDTSGSKGDIVIDPALGGNAFDLEGIYVASGSFQTGASTLPLRVRGSVVGYDSVLLQRDLSGLNLATPAEYFEYAPDLSLLFPSVLGARKITWKEVAP